jgi:hypothetical protein
VTEQRAFLWYFLVDNFGKCVVGLKKLFKYLIGVVGESVTSLEFALSKETLPEFFPAILVIKRPLDGVAEDFVGLWNFREVMVRCLLIFFGEFRVPAQYFFLVVLGDFLVAWIPSDA